MVTVLVAEDEVNIRDLIKERLVEKSFNVLTAEDGVIALEKYKKNKVDFLIIDVMMPRLDGFNLLREIRRDSNVPAIFLTARGDEMNKILGLGIGADDYLVKPFSMAELIARVEANVRRHRIYDKFEKETSILAGSLELKSDKCEVYKSNERIELLAN